jgi:NADPH:quinone reductase-like Zn-dependent oxidoreductase
VKAYQIGAQDGIAALTAVTRPDPAPGPGEAAIRVRLIGLNNRDIQAVEGRYGARKAPERVPTSEGIGEIVALGDGVSGLAVGDRVVAPHFVTWLDGPFAMSAFAQDAGITRDGWLAEQVVLPAAALVKVPDALDDLRAAALASAAVTAWNAVVTVGGVKPGDLVLALGTGGVAIWALQIAKAHGAEVAITSSSDEKLAAARKLGADYTVNYATHPDWAAELLRQTGGRGADIVAETGGQATLPASINAAAANARIVLIAVGSTDTPLPNYGAIIGKNLVIKGITSGSRAMLEALVGCIVEAGIEPVIDRVFAFDEAPEAYAYLKTGGHVGKILIRVSSHGA